MAEITNGLIVLESVGVGLPHPSSPRQDWQSRPSSPADDHHCPSQLPALALPGKTRAGTRVDTPESNRSCTRVESDWDTGCQDRPTSCRIRRTIANPWPIVRGTREIRSGLLFGAQRR